jgi:hypothetical protein
MSILKKNNLNDPYNFLPDNQTVGTFGYWKRKFGDKFDDFTYEIWEAQSRLEGDEQLKVIDSIIGRKRKYEELMIEDIESRQHQFGDEDSQKAVDLIYQEYLETQRKILECNTINESSNLSDNI